MNSYGFQFYAEQSEGSLRSAQEVVPILIQLLRPSSVVDVGSGLGTWLSVFVKHGIEDIRGIDGQWVNRELLRIPADKFMVWDLEKPLKADRQFDLAISLEVAEHLPETSASTFIKTLTGFSKSVFFSAAIPCQDGAHHVNTQWPEYWVSLFEQEAYIAIDCIRKKIWYNRNVEYWYRQNALLFVSQSFLECHTQLKKELDLCSGNPLSIVHPSCFLRYADPKQISLRRWIRNFPTVLVSSMRRHISRHSG